MTNFKIDELKIDKLANLAVKRGVGLQKGQNLLITAPIESIPLVRKIAEHAYREGANIVTPLFTDSDITLSRFKFAPNESFDTATDWLYNGMGEAFDNNTARMAIAGDDPMLLSKMDPEKVSRANKAKWRAVVPLTTDIEWFAFTNLENLFSNCADKGFKTNKINSPTKIIAIPIGLKISIIE